MFDLDQFIADCRTAVNSDPTHKSAREVVARAVSDPSAVVAGLGEPERAQVQKLYLTNRPNYLRDYETWARLYQDVFVRRRF